MSDRLLPRCLAYAPHLVMGVTLLLVFWCLATELTPEGDKGAAYEAAPYLLRSATFALVTALGQTFLGLAAALCVLWLTRSARSRLLLITLFILPYAIPAALIGLVFRFAAGSQSAWAQATSSLFGLSPDFWVDEHPLRAAMIACIWQFFPFAFLLIFMAIRSIPKETIRSAQMDGAGFWMLLRDIVIADIWPVVLSVFTLRLVFMLVKFDTPFVFTETRSSLDDVATVELWRTLAGTRSAELSLLAWSLQIIVILISVTYILSQRSSDR